MQFVEMTGKTLKSIVSEEELELSYLEETGVHDETIVRVNQQGDIEVRRPDKWDVIGGLLGDFHHRIREKTGMEWV
jgi:hypothetical protein